MNRFPGKQCNYLACLRPIPGADVHPAYDRVFLLRVRSTTAGYWHGVEEDWPGALPPADPSLHFWNQSFERVRKPRRTEWQLDSPLVAVWTPLSGGDQSALHVRTLTHLPSGRTMTLPAGLELKHGQWQIWAELAGERLLPRIPGL